MENCWVPDGATLAVAGLRLLGVGLAGSTNTVALAACVGSATLVAEIVTNVSPLIELGAEYNPAEILPRPCVIDQTT